jgi:hypothetical protein
MVAYLHYFVVLEQIVAHLTNLVPTPIFAFLLPHGLEIVALFWAIFNTFAHLISSLILERFVVLYWT